jgi:hypothetical protein
METNKARSTNSRRSLRRLIIAVGVTALVGGIAASPAHADNDHWRHGHEAWRDHRGHEWREHRWHEHHGYAVRAYPGYAYGYPPPVIYAPPPVVYAPPVYAAPSLSFVFPLR